MDRPWQVVKRETVYDSDWIGLQRVDVRLPDGQIVHRVHLVDYKHPAAAVVAIADDGKVLLIEHYRFQTDTTGWEIPAGRVEESESAELAARREMQEETGYRVGALHYLGRYHPSNGSSNQVFHVFIGRDVVRVGDIEDKNEVMGLKWFTPEEVRILIARNEILDGFTLTALCWALVLGEM